MQLNTSSRFTQLNDYAMLEFEYNSNIISTADVDFMRILNAYSGQMSYFNYNPSNYDAPKKLTGNSLDRTVQKIGDSNWVLFDLDRPLQYFEQNDALAFQPIYLGRKTEINMIYDTIKIHIVSGYNFEEISGFIINAAYVDLNTFDQVSVANIAYLKEDTFINLNVHPILLGDRLYDRYIEVKIPSLRGIIDNELQIKDVFTPTINYGDGIIYPNLFNIPDYSKSKINITFYEVLDYGTGTKGQIEIKTAMPIGNDTNGVIRREIAEYDSFANLVSVIQESVSGDYFEVFPMYNGEFLDNFIADQAKLGHNYVGIHDIELYEQLSTFGEYSEVLTHSQSFFQNSGFDNIFKFRPVIENANAVTFTIEYIFRLLDKTDNSQVIRRATFTYPYAAKYGRWLQKLNIPLGFQPLKIVNKIVKYEDKTLTSNIYNLNKSDKLLQGSNSTTLVPFQFKDISVNSYSLFVDSSTPFNTKVLFENMPNTTVDTTKLNLKDFINSNVIFGQGDCRIYLNKYDNFIKFKVFKYIDKVSGMPQVYTDLKSNDTLNIYMIFHTATGEEIRIKEYQKVENLDIKPVEDGVLIFKITTTDAQKIIDSATSDFVITIENSISGKVIGTNAWNTRRDFEVVLYSGKWDMLTNYLQMDQMEYDLKSKLLQKLIDSLNAQESKISLLKADYTAFLSNIKDLQLNTEQQKSLDDFNTRWATLIEEAKKI